LNSNSNFYCNFGIIMARKYQAVLPISVQAGHILLVRADDRSIRVRFPKKLKAGDVFYFVIPNADECKSKPDPEAIFDASTEAPSTIRDWIVSVGLGLIVSVSIIFGFLMGVLYVTKPGGSLPQMHPGKALTDADRQAHQNLHNILRQRMDEGYAAGKDVNSYLAATAAAAAAEAE
jgi:hypothetical protein